MASGLVSRESGATVWRGGCDGLARFVPVCRPSLDCYWFAVLVLAVDFTWLTRYLIMALNMALGLLHIMGRQNERGNENGNANAEIARGMLQGQLVPALASGMFSR